MSLSFGHFSHDVPSYALFVGASHGLSFVNSRHGKDDPFRDVHRMVADTFKIFCYHQQIERVFSVCGSLGYHVYKRTLDFEEIIVHRVVVRYRLLSNATSLFMKASMLSVTMRMVASAIRQMGSQSTPAFLSIKVIISAMSDA